MRSRRWLFLALLLLAVLAPYLPVALGSSFWVKDTLRFVYEQKLYLRGRLLHGELPLWWPNLGLGRPFLGMLQPGVLYPGNVLLLLPMPLGYDLFTVAHAAVAALGMRAWLRRLGDEESASCVGALVFALSGYFVSVLAGNSPYAYGIAWIPTLLWAALSPARLLPRAATLALLFALVLSAGDPQAVFFAALALAVQALAQPAARRGSDLGALALAGTLAAAVALVLLVPGLEVASVGRPGGAALDDAAHFSMHPARLLELVWPGLYGTPYTSTWFVSPLVDEGLGGGYTPFAPGIYFGLLAPLFGVAAVFAKRADRRRLDVALGLFTLACVVLALGRHAYVWSVFFRVVPAAKLFRYPEKYFALATLGLAYLSARGFAAAVRNPRRSMRVGSAALVMLAACALATTLFGRPIMSALVPRLSITGVTAEAAGLVARDRTLRTLAFALVAWLPFALAARGRLATSRLQLAIVMLVAIDLVGAALPLLDWAPSTDFVTASPILDALPAMDPMQPPLRLYRPNDKVFGGDMTALLERTTFLPNCGVEAGIDHLDAYDVFHPPAEDALWAVLRAHPLKLMQLTATRFAFLGDDQLGGAHPQLRVVRAYPQLHASLVEIDGAAPRVYLAQTTEVASDPHDAATRMLAPTFVPGQSAVLEGGTTGATASITTGTCTLDAFHAERIALHCDASAPGYAILADAAYPGWHAVVDGRDTPILRANAALRAIAVPAGTSHVALRYRPRGFGVATIISLLSLCVALALALRRRESTTA